MIDSLLYNTIHESALWYILNNSSSAPLSPHHSNLHIAPYLQLSRPFGVLQQIFDRSYEFTKTSCYLYTGRPTYISLQTENAALISLILTHPCTSLTVSTKNTV